jgi:hypothetical protein
MASAGKYMPNNQLDKPLSTRDYEESKENFSSARKVISADPTQICQRKKFFSLEETRCWSVEQVQ